ncbi:DUF481 domain-containing protein [Cyclobacterium xiamenense]|uniref:DUF481 domain-containing protein n=1 Tax=Cyclobacterium xiamenense TaxID=1297121 RepID=UPI0012B860A5|nr:DUF481 domain-containing protein [Cyclobacterium xiamenense]
MSELSTQHKSPGTAYVWLPILLLVSVLYSQATAQVDTLGLRNGNVLHGEIKSMDKGVLKMETDYSDEDFKIEWEKIAFIQTTTQFIIMSKNKNRFVGTLLSPDSARVHVVSNRDTLATLPYEEVIYLNSLKTKFLDRLSASIGLSYNFTRANDLRQFNVRSTLGYRAKKWSATGSYNDLRSFQEGSTPIRRLNADTRVSYFLKKNWFGLAAINLLSNTEQLIELRTVSKLGLGKYIVRTNRTYWGFTGGISFNNEVFSLPGSNPRNRSGEGFIGSELNLYGLDDLSLISHVVAYPSLTESGRWRIDYSFDVKYDLPLNLYFGLGFTVNFDNRPRENASRSDYVFQTSFGWKL